MNGGGQEINATMVELMQHVQQMDCRTAHENMCRAQDEIERLQQQLDQMGEEECVDEADDDDDVSNNVGSSASHDLEGTNNNDSATSRIASTTDDKNTRLPSKIDPSPREPMTMKDDEHIKNIKRVHGLWLDEGGKCSIEYLPNIKCYHITLTTTHQNDDAHIIPKRDDLQFTMSPVQNERQSKKSLFSSQIAFNEMKLVHASSTLLSLILPGCQTTANHHDNPTTATISVDSQSISLRIHIQIIDSLSMDIMDNLLGIEGSIFSPITTSCSAINHLYCRSCQTPIVVKNNNNSTIQSVLPLPSGYWDDIEDYLICYDGQANVDFNTSTMNAIRHVALEDDAVIVLHEEDVNEGDSGVCTTRDVKGYGEHSALLGRNGGGEITSSASQIWKDKSAMKGDKGNTITCSNCCSALGFVSGHDSNTLRFYKHLLHCGIPSLLDKKNVFSNYTCGSFLSREMVRYADNEAIYTFIVGVSDENDWTRMGKSSECILLHILSWDSALVGVDGKMSSGGGDGGEAIQLEKVLKVIFDETTDRGQHSSSGREDDGTKWTWGGIDLCCPPSMVDEEFSPTDKPQTKATSVRIFLSTQEWSELKHTLTTGSEYFSGVVKDAIVMSKLGMPMIGSRHSASLSYLPLIN